MTTLLKRNLMIAAGAALVMTMGVADANATTFSTISTNVLTSMANLPALLAGVSYMFGLILGVLGILKIKDHVENPSQTPLKDGAIRLAAGGGLFALPIVTQAMLGTVGAGGASVTAPTLTAITP